MVSAGAAPLPFRAPIQPRERKIVATITQGLKATRLVSPSTAKLCRKTHIPVSLPLSSGMTLPTALAAPVLEGMMLNPAPLPVEVNPSTDPSGGKSKSARREYY